MECVSLSLVLKQQPAKNLRLFSLPKDLEEELWVEEASVIPPAFILVTEELI